MKNPLFSKCFSGKHKKKVGILEMCMIITLTPKYYLFNLYQKFNFHGSANKNGSCFCGIAIR
jgi:hypothetical protein